MTRANSEQFKNVPWFAKAGAACSIVPIARFVSENIFALKGGGYGCFFRLTGVDEEGLTDQELESQLRMIEGSLRGLPEGGALYQYTRVRSGFPLPRQANYPNPVTQVFVEERLHFLEANAGFRRIDLHWCLIIEPSQVKTLEKQPQENAAQTTRVLAELQKTAALLAGNLNSSVGLELLGKQDVFRFLSYLFNLEDWVDAGELQGDKGVDRQVVQSPVSWESDHLRIGKRFVQMPFGALRPLLCPDGDSDRGCAVQPGYRSREAWRFFWFSGVSSGSYPVLCTGSRFGPIRRPAASSLFCFRYAALRVTVSSFAGPSANAELRPWEAGPLAWLRLV